MPRRSNGFRRLAPIVQQRCPRCLQGQAFATLFQIRAQCPLWGDENEKRTGIVNPLNSASTHTMTSFSRFDFCRSFCTNFQGIYRLLPPPKGRGEAVHKVHNLHSCPKIQHVSY